MVSAIDAGDCYVVREPAHFVTMVITPHSWEAYDHPVHTVPVDAVPELRPVAWLHKIGHDVCVSANPGSFDRALLENLGRWRLDISPNQLALLKSHFAAMIDANRTVNLTRITDPADAAVKHYADSLALLLWARAAGIAVATVLDVGTGAGFPALPLAVVRPDWAITAIDGTDKKVRFLAGVAERLAIPNLQAEHAHSHHWPDRRHFPIAVARGVGSLAKCMIHAGARVSVGGWLVVYKTADLDKGETLHAAEWAPRRRFEPLEPFLYELLWEGATLRRALHVFQRTSSAEG